MICSRSEAGSEQSEAAEKFIVGGRLRAEVDLAPDVVSGSVDF